MFGPRAIRSCGVSLVLACLGGLLLGVPTRSEDRVGSPSAPVARRDERLERYVNEKHRCSLYYSPERWRLQVQSGSGSDAAIFTAIEDSDVMAVLNMFDPVPDLSLHPRQLFDMDRGALATIFGGLAIQEEQVLTLSGAMAHRVTFEGREKRVTRYTIAHQGFVYLLVYVAPKPKYEAYLPAFRLMVETFRIFGTGVPEADPRALSMEVVAEPAGERALRVHTRPDPVFVEVREGDQNWHYHLVLTNPHESDVELREVYVRYVSHGRVLEETRLDSSALARVLEGGTTRLPPKGSVEWRDHAGHRAEGAPERIEYVLFFRMGERFLQQTYRVRLVRYEPKTRFTLPFTGIWRVWRGHDVFEGHRQQADAQAFAYDFIYERGGRDRRAPDATARRASVRRPQSKERSPAASQLADFSAFGRKVLAPADGVVVRAVDGEPDRPPAATRPRLVHPKVTNPRQLFGNYIVLDHGQGEFSLLAHLKRGSVRVRRGDRVTRGQVIAECGNSGVSAQPHLHFHVMDGPDPLRSRGLPIRFEMYRLWRDGRAVLIRSGVPRAGEHVERVVEPARRVRTRSSQRQASAARRSPTRSGGQRPTGARR